MSNSSDISRFKPGSLRELIAISLPLILAALSENIMIFFDRIILSHYSLTALNATTLASQAVEIFQFSLIAISSICEIIIAKLYVQNALTDLAKPCWQMIYLSLAFMPLAFILGQYTGQYILPPAYLQSGNGYYQIYIYSIPILGIIVALSGFFVGQGKTRLVLYSTIVANGINLILDFPLIFGFGNIIPAMGTQGAAIAAIIALLMQMAWLFLIYLNRYHRQHYHTHKLQFDFASLKEHIRIGFPISANHALEMLGLLIITKIVAQTGSKNFTIISIGNTLYLIYACINDGLYRAICAVISNHIGANNRKAINKTLRKGFIILSLFLICLALIFIIMPNGIIHLFNLKHYNQHWYHDIHINFLFIWCYFLFSGIYWLFAAALTAKYRTKFIMVVNICGIWLGSLLPIYLPRQQQTLPSSIIWALLCVYVAISSIVAIIYYYRHTVTLPKLS